MLSIRTKDVHAEKAVEAFRRAKFKFPGVSKSFRVQTGALREFKRDDYVKWKASGERFRTG